MEIEHPQYGTMPNYCGSHFGNPDEDPFCYVLNEASCVEKQASDDLPGNYWIYCEEEQTVESKF